MTENDLSRVFAQGMTFEAYLPTMQTLQRHMREQYETLPVADTAIAEFAATADGRGVNRILILTEDFCPDSAMNIPIAARLADAIPALALRIVRRDHFWDIANRFPAADGNSHIPTVIFLTENGSAAGVWHERSAAAHELVKNFVAENPRPPAELPTGERNHDFLHWRKRLLNLQKAAYCHGLWFETVREWQERISGGRTSGE